MAHYSIIEDGRIVNVFVAEPAFAATQKGWVETPPSYGIGDFYDGVTFKKMSEVFGLTSDPQVDDGNG